MGHCCTDSGMHCDLAHGLRSPCWEQRMSEIIAPQTALRPPQHTTSHRSWLNLQLAITSEANSSCRFHMRTTCGARRQPTEHLSSQSPHLRTSGPGQNNRSFHLALRSEGVERVSFSYCKYGEFGQLTVSSKSHLY